MGDSRRPATNQPTMPMARRTAIAAIQYVVIVEVTDASSDSRFTARMYTPECGSPGMSIGTAM